MESDELTWEDYCYLHTCVMYVRVNERDIDRAKLDKLQAKLTAAMEREEEKQFNNIRSQYA